MLTVKQAFKTTVGMKFLMAISGLSLVGFVILHLAGNLILLQPNGSLFNAYAEKLASLGPLLEAAEIVLLSLAGMHVMIAFRLKYLATQARPVGYQLQNSKKGPSKMDVASKNLIFTGALLLLFLVVHIKQFKFGPGIAEGYVQQLDGKSIRDLHRLVVESFHQPVIVAFYSAAMLFLGMHLKHGIWSAFHSLGATQKRTQAFIYSLGLALAGLLAVGFLLIPVWIYLDLPFRFFGATS
ncbi:MAG: succinate dehydrogenase cytochrome b subunit [Bdellovibrionia bacterium]